MPTLGLQEIQWGWRVQGVLALDRLLLLSMNIIELVGMTPDGPPDIRFYPNGKNKGGHGVQVYSPLVESWLIISTWPQHGFMRVNLSSCKPYDPSKVAQYLEAHVGPVQAEGGFDL